MLIPSTAARVQQFYALGNTPADSLTRTLPQGVDAAILSLGCGDVRNVLYTAYVEQGFPSRKLDITCCDYSEDIHVRNIVFFSYLIDGLETDQQLDRLWDVYYHLYVDDEAVHFLATQIKKLSEAATSFEAWGSSVYGRHLRFCDHSTFRDFGRGLAKYHRAISQRKTKQYAQTFRDRLKKVEALRDAILGKDTPILTGFRSVAPITKAIEDIPGCFSHYWKYGTTTTSPCQIPNPTFAASISENLRLHYGTEPTLGYHLATGYVNLTDASPLKIVDDVPGASNLVKAARSEFRAMARAFQAQRNNFVIRFVTADALAFCFTLQTCSSSKRSALTANWYRRQFEQQRLELDHSEYSGAGEKAGPVIFNVIDTSNLADHIGTLKVLVAGIPLLSDTSYSTLLTELLIQREDSEEKTFDSLLCGHTPTVALLLGVTPAEFYTNARSTSGFDDIVSSYFSLSQEDSVGNQLRSRLSWKLAHYFSGEAGGQEKINIAPSQLAAVLMSIYRDMFFYEDPEALIGDGSKEFINRQLRKVRYPCYHRGSLAAAMKALKGRVATDWTATCKELIQSIQADKAIMLGSNYIQDFISHLQMWDVHIENWLSEDSERYNATGSAEEWTLSSQLVAVTFVVPRAEFDKLFGPRIPEEASPTLVVGLLTVYTKGARNSPDFEVIVNEDRKGWQGTSPLIVCFHVPALALNFVTPTSEVSLELHSDLQTLQTYMGLYDEAMSVYKTTFGDKSSVFVTKFCPGQDDYPAVSPPEASLGDVDTARLSTRRTELTLAVDIPSGRLSTITGRISIDSKKGKQLLENKNVEIKLAPGPSPFIINVVFGDEDLVCPVHFSAPVVGETARLRIARKSSWIEAVAKIAEPGKVSSLQDLIYPATLDKTCGPVTLSAPHINLDVLPIVDVSNKEELTWIQTLVSLSFSTHERKLRNQTQSTSATGISANVRLNIKESLFSIFLLASGIQGDQTGLFAITHPEKGGIHMLLLISSLRLDSTSGSVVADAAIIPFTLDTIHMKGLQSFLTFCQRLRMCTLRVDDAELAAWKKMVPSMVERCRTWTHNKARCEYAKPHASIPLSTEFGEPVICSCGQGKLPDQFISVPLWKEALPYATRIAISPLLSLPFVEESIDTAELSDITRQRNAEGRMKAQAKWQIKTKAKAVAKEPLSIEKLTSSLKMSTPHSESEVKALSQTDPNDPGKASGQELCSNCGATGAQSGTALKKCTRCQTVKYCSVACQKADWRKHRPECKEAAK